MTDNEQSRRMSVDNRKDFVQRRKTGRWGSDRILRTLAASEEYIAWSKGAVLSRIILRQVPDGWQAVVKAAREKDPGVAFVTCSSLGDLLEILSQKIGDDELEWKPDKYG